MIKLIAFDFDGTITDTVDFCLHVYEKTFAKFMEHPPLREDIFQTFGMNEPGLLRHFMGYECPEAEQYYYKLHRELHSEMCPDCFYGIRDLFEFIRAKNIKMVLLTGRSETTAEISLECLNIKHYFSEFMYGSAERNIKAEQLAELVERYNLKNDEIVYVGDTVSDALESQSVNVKCLSAAWTESARVEELEKVNPGLVFCSISKIQDYIDKNSVAFSK